MDSTALVDNQIEDGGKLVDQLLQDGFDVTSAFWIRFFMEEDGPWFYIVSKTVDSLGLIKAYMAVHKSIQKIPPPWGPYINCSDVGELKLVGKNDSLGKEVIALRDRYPGRIRFRRPDIHNQGVEDLYIYPVSAKPSVAN